MLNTIEKKALLLKDFCIWDLISSAVSEKLSDVKCNRRKKCSASKHFNFWGLIFSVVSEILSDAKYIKKKLCFQTFWSLGLISSTTFNSFKKIFLCKIEWKKESYASRQFNLWDLISSSVSEKLFDVKHRRRKKALLLKI